MPEEPTDTVEAALKRVLNDAQNYTGFNALVDAFEAAVRADERSKAQPDSALRAAWS